MLSLERDRAEPWRDRRGVDDHPYLTADNRLVAGRWLRSQGNVAEAARLLTFHEAILWPAPQTLQANDMLAGLVYLERARAEEALGHREVAREYYDQFLRRYDLPVAAHRHHVEDARLAVVRLRGDPAVAARHNSKIAHASRANAP